MSTVKADEYIDLVKRSGLVTGERLTEALSDIKSPVSDSAIVGSSLVTAGLLTTWQNERLLQGQYRGFFLGKYKILDRIGAGGMGCVYLAEHVIMKHRVAVKVLSRNLSSSSLVDRFHQEARAAATFNHPHLVRSLDVDEAGNLHYLVMEYVDGKNLQLIVLDRGPLPFREAAEYARQAAEGLAHAHAAGLIHRDVKPANLLVDRQGTVKVLDLGLVRVTDERVASLTLTHDEKQIGTIDYLAPEQAADSHNVDARADIYSLGCTLYFMLTGRPPFADASVTRRIILHQNAEPECISKVRPDVPPALLAICRRMMAKSPEGRYRSMTEVSRALLDWLKDESVVAHDEVPKHQPVRHLESTAEDLPLALVDDDEPIADVNRAPASSSTMRNGHAKTTDIPRAKPRAQESDSLLDEALAEVAAISHDSGLGLNVMTAGHSSIAKTQHPKSAGSTGSGLRGKRGKDHDGIYPLWFLMLAGAFLAGLLLLVGFSCIWSFSAPPPSEKVRLD